MLRMLSLVNPGSKKMAIHFSAMALFGHISRYIPWHLGLKWPYFGDLPGRDFRSMTWRIKDEKSRCTASSIMAESTPHIEPARRLACGVEPIGRSSENHIASIPWTKTRMGTVTTHDFMKKHRKSGWEYIVFFCFGIYNWCTLHVLENGVPGERNRKQNFKGFPSFDQLPLKTCAISPLVYFRHLTTLWVKRWSCLYISGYPLVMTNIANWQISILRGKSTINGPFSIAMLNYQRVYLYTYTYTYTYTYIYIHMYICIYTWTHIHIYIYIYYIYICSIYFLVALVWVVGGGWLHQIPCKNPKKYGKTSPLPVRPASVAGGKVLVPASPFRRRIHRSTWFIRDG